MNKAVIAVSIILLLVSSMLFYYANTIFDPKTKLERFYARKEDLYTSQLKIEQLLNSLNQTILAETENQKALNEKITELSIKSDLPPPTINTTKIVQEPPVIVKIQKPVTRAS